MSKKRYEALYLAPNMCDGIWDNKTNEYLDDETIEKLLNKEDYDSIWEERFIKENKRVKELEHKLRYNKKIILANKFIELLDLALSETNK